MQSKAQDSCEARLYIEMTTLTFRDRKIESFLLKYLKFVYVENGTNTKYKRMIKKHLWRLCILYRT